jgi:hypothetical protein
MGISKVVMGLNLCHLVPLALSSNIDKRFYVVYRHGGFIYKHMVNYIKCSCQQITCNQSKPFIAFNGLKAQIENKT